MINPIHIEKKIYRGAQPQSQDDFKALVDLGVKVVLDLETGCYMLNDGQPSEERKWATGAGINRFFSCPMFPVLPPHGAQLRRAINLMNIYVADGIYVHCKQGVDRTGFVVASYRMEFDHWQECDAVAEMRRLGSHWWFGWWTWFL